ncbi:uncharacterized protein [Montipora capricornis]|uniref:uncharacterized protein n=1 Tax=Montipora capricornis TaxID=246305 RepID=UPI0035F13C3A
MDRLVGLILQLTIFGFEIAAADKSLYVLKCDVDFETKGCFKDMKVKRTLPYYIYNERDPSNANYGGTRIDYLNWNQYFPGFVCRCAQKAEKMGYDLFGVQYYGECWAGHSHLHDYAQHGQDSDGQGCIAENYQPCADDSRFCVGTQWHNMVYQMVDTSCQEAAFERIECFADRHVEGKRPLPNYLFSDRDPKFEKFSGKMMDWRNWDVYLPQFVCRCAKAAKGHGSTFFGMQFYGECWSGEDARLTYDIDGYSSWCVDSYKEPCMKHDQFCSGGLLSNFVYKLKDATCEVTIVPVDCYKDDPTNPVMKDIFYNEASPGEPNFGGKILQWSANYTEDFSSFLCKCGRYARQNGWEYFGVRRMGQA